MSLQAAVAMRFALKVTFELLYNNAPPAGFERQDRSLNVSQIVKLGRSGGG